MKVEIIEPSGYCSGVALAMNLTKEVRLNNPKATIVVLGMLVHNQDALKELDDLNIETLFVKGESLLETAKQIEDGSIVILTAHGHTLEVEEYLNARGLKFYDATCPFVTQSHKIIKEALKQNRDVVYIGKKGHPEANAALSLGGVALIEKDSYEIFNHLRKPIVIGQTTMSEDEVQKEFEGLVTRNQHLKFEYIKGVCTSSTRRQEALKELNKDVELIYVVGGSNSNNTLTLFNLAKAYHPQAKVILIENANDINKKDLLGLSYIAISSGASTPIHIVEEVKSKIELLSD